MLQSRVMTENADPSRALDNCKAVKSDSNTAAQLW